MVNIDINHLSLLYRRLPSIINMLKINLRVEECTIYKCFINRNDLKYISVFDISHGSDFLALI
jgi:hypothetical protein